MEQRDGSEIDVEIELEPQPQQDVPRVLVARDAGVAEGAQQNGVDTVPQMSKRRIGKGLSRLEEMIGGIGEPL